MDRERCIEKKEQRGKKDREKGRERWEKLRKANQYLPPNL